MHPAVLVWPPEREHRKDAANGFKGEGACLGKEPPGLPVERGESQKPEKPRMESLLGKLQAAGEEFWRWFRFYKKGNRTDPRRLRTSFRNKFCQAQHRYDKTSKTRICRFCGDSTETV